jgi:altronate dehydratase
MSEITVIPVSEEFIVKVVDDVNVVVTQIDTSTVIVAQSLIQTGGSVVLTNYYNKTETDTLLAGKANLVHTHVINDITDFEGTVLSSGTF